jgi:hypothetical protein
LNTETKPQDSKKGEICAQDLYIVTVLINATSNWDEIALRVVKSADY